MVKVNESIYLKSLVFNLSRAEQEEDFKKLGFEYVGKLNKVPGYETEDDNLCLWKEEDGLDIAVLHDKTKKLSLKCILPDVVIEGNKKKIALNISFNYASDKLLYVIDEINNCEFCNKGTFRLNLIESSIEESTGTGILEITFSMNESILSKLYELIHCEFCHTLTSFTYDYSFNLHIARNPETIKELLLAKCKEEYAFYLKTIKSRGIEEVIVHSAETAIKNEFMEYLQNDDIPDTVLEYLDKQCTPLHTFYENYLKGDVADILYIVKDVLEDLELRINQEK